MHFEIKNRFTGETMFAAELEARHESESYSIQLGAAVKLAVKARANLAGAHLAGAYLPGANLTGANLERAHLAGANLAGVNLSGVNLSCANLSGAYLTGAYLARADLAGADLAGANLSGAYLTGADMTGANLVGGVTIRDGITATRAPICVSGLTWPVTIWDRHMQIGCEFHSHDAWRRFTTRDWLRMGGQAAVKLRDQHLDALMALCDAHAANERSATAA